MKGALLGWKYFVEAGKIDQAVKCSCDASSALRHGKEAPWS